MSAQVRLPPGSLHRPHPKKIRNFMKRFCNTETKLTTAMEAAKDYANLYDNINNIVLTDLMGGKKVSLKDGEFTKDSEENLIQYLKDLETMNINGQLNHILENLDNTNLTPDDQQRIKNTLNNWHEKSVEEWDDKLEKAILHNLNSNHIQKCKKSFGVFNFTDNEIPTNTYNLLTLGKKMVVPYGMTPAEKKTRVTAECFNYAVRFRKYIEGREEDIKIEDKNYKSWLEAAGHSASNSTYADFYTKLKNNLEEEEMYNQPITKYDYFQTKTEIITALDYPGAIWNECDKGMGISLIPINTMKTAELNMIKELGGSPCNLNKEELITHLEEQLQEFKEELDGRQKWLLEEHVGNLNNPDKSQLVTPFLHLKLKIHKVAEDDIKNKNTNALKFRPIVDQSRWMFNYHSTALRELLDNMNREIIEQSNGTLDDILPVNGASVAADTRNFTFNNVDGIKSLLSADLSDAYSNTDLKDLEEAVEYVGEHTGLEAWVIELIIKLARLILKNNYVETSKGVYHLTTVLPMGMGASPVCLNIVGLASEHRRLVSQGARSTTMGDCKSYQRYLDDTRTLGESKNVDGIKDIIMNIATMFPKVIPINIECSHVYNTFLDVVSIRKLSTGKVETIMKKNMGTPPGFIPVQSKIPYRYKMSGLNGDILRIRRICSKPAYIKLHDEMLIREYITLGYHPKRIEESFQERLKVISEEFDSEMNRISKKEKMEGLVYGSTTKMEFGGETHIITKEIIRSALGDLEARPPMTIPSTKLVEFLHTRKRYFKKLRTSN